jgi:hypothetical protein
VKIFYSLLKILQERMGIPGGCFQRDLKIEIKKYSKALPKMGRDSILVRFTP